MPTNVQLEELLAATPSTQGSPPRGQEWLTPGDLKTEEVALKSIQTIHLGIPVLHLFEKYERDYAHVMQENLSAEIYKKQDEISSLQRLSQELQSAISSKTSFEDFQKKHSSLIETARSLLGNSLTLGKKNWNEDLIKSQIRVLDDEKGSRLDIIKIKINELSNLKKEHTELIDIVRDTMNKVTNFHSKIVENFRV